jgi:hypothetical protein
VGFVRRGRRAPTEEPPPFTVEREPARVPLPRAAALALVLTVPLALLFAKRTGVVIFPALTVILWRGIGTRALTAAAAGLLGLAVPLLYVIEAPTDRGGFNFEYSLQTLDAHWVAEGALVLLMVACWRAISDTRAGPDPVSEPSAPQAELAHDGRATARPAGAAPARAGGG